MNEYKNRNQRNGMNFKHEIIKIKKRNTRADADKAWERSFFRCVLTSLIAYGFIAYLLKIVNVPEFFNAAIIPAIAYFVIQVVLFIIKRIWLKLVYYRIRNKYKNKYKKNYYEKKENNE